MKEENLSIFIHELLAFCARTIDQLNVKRGKGGNDKNAAIVTSVIYVCNVIFFTLFPAGTDTSIFTMHWCVGLLVQHPEVQAKVAAELDSVVGRDRLPSLNDRDNLPYTTATLYEVMRYSNLVPLAVPHATSTDVEFGEYSNLVPLAVPHATSTHVEFGECVCLL